MTEALTVLGISASTFTLLALIFAHEAKTQKRYAAAVRHRLDVVVDSGAVHIDAAAKRFGSGAVQLLTHHVCAWLLESLLTSLRIVEAAINRLVKRNSARVATLSEARSSEQSLKLQEIAAHKAATKLTDKQKQARKAAHLEGEI